MNVFCVRAEFGTCTKSFVAGGYVAIGRMPESDLTAIVFAPQGRGSQMSRQ
jgi:restriction system protein